MNSTRNSSLRVVRHSIYQYRAHELSIDGLQRNIASVMTALEGDVPQDIRDEILNAENSIELIRFMVSSAEQRAAVEAVLQRIEATVSKYGSGDTEP